MKIHHIGYLVKDINKAIHSFEELGFCKETDTVYDEYRGIDICFMKKEAYRIELVSPKAPDSIVASLRKKIGNTPYHICYEVSNLEKAISLMREKKYVIWQEPHEAIAIGGRRAAFMVNNQVGMIELVEN